MKNKILLLIILFQSVYIFAKENLRDVYFFYTYNYEIRVPYFDEVILYKPKTNLLFRCTDYSKKEYNVSNMYFFIYEDGSYGYNNSSDFERFSFTEDGCEVLAEKENGEKIFHKYRFEETENELEVFEMKNTEYSFVPYIKIVYNLNDGGYEIYEWWGEITGYHIRRKIYFSNDGHPIRIDSYSDNIPKNMFVKYSYIYDKAGKLLSDTTYEDKEGAIKYKETYSYDKEKKLKFYKGKYGSIWKSAICAQNRKGQLIYKRNIYDNSFYDYYILPCDINGNVIYENTNIETAKKLQPESKFKKYKQKIKMFFKNLITPRSKENLRDIYFFCNYGIRVPFLENKLVIYKPKTNLEFRRVSYTESKKANDLTMHFFIYEDGSYEYSYFEGYRDKTFYSEKFSFTDDGCEVRTKTKDGKEIFHRYRFEETKNELEVFIDEGFNSKTEHVKNIENPSIPYKKIIYKDGYYEIYEWWGYVMGYCLRQRISFSKEGYPIRVDLYTNTTPENVFIGKSFMYDKVGKLLVDTKYKNKYGAIEKEIVYSYNRDKLVIKDYSEESEYDFKEDSEGHLIYLRDETFEDELTEYYIKKK